MIKFSTIGKIPDGVIYLYMNGESSYSIARLLNIDASYVRSIIKKAGIARNPGRDIEKLVRNKLLKEGHQVEQMKGDYPFDLLVDGKRIDVKSASLTINNKKANCFGYKFQIQDGSHRKTMKDFKKLIDEFYLVFLDLPDQPIYSIDSQVINANYTISIPPTFATKYPIKFMGYLGC